MAHDHVSHPSTKEPRSRGAGLTAAQLSSLREALEAKKAELSRALAAVSAEQAEDIPQAPDADAEGDAADLAEGVIEDSREGVRYERDRALLGEVERALGRMQTGTYGTSEGSGRPIPLERLRAVPWTRYDLEDEAAHEVRVP